MATRNEELEIALAIVEGLMHAPPETRISSSGGTYTSVKLKPPEVPEFAIIYFIGGPLDAKVEYWPGAELPKDLDLWRPPAFPGESPPPTYRMCQVPASITRFASPNRIVTAIFVPNILL